MQQQKSKQNIKEMIGESLLIKAEQLWILNNSRSNEEAHRF